jgi:hypothetical protein
MEKANAAITITIIDLSVDESAPTRLLHLVCYAPTSSLDLTAFCIQRDAQFMVSFANIRLVVTTNFVYLP